MVIGLYMRPDSISETCFIASGCVTTFYLSGLGKWLLATFVCQLNVPTSFIRLSPGVIMVTVSALVPYMKLHVMIQVSVETCKLRHELLPGRLSWRFVEQGVKGSLYSVMLVMSVLMMPFVCF